MINICLKGDVQPASTKARNNNRRLILKKQKYKNQLAQNGYYESYSTRRKQFMEGIFVKQTNKKRIANKIILFNDLNK